MDNNAINICTLRFKEHLGLDQARLMRGAIVKIIGRENNVLFHNHIKTGLRYAYPLVQYKSIDDCAAIVGIGDAATKLQELMPLFPCELRLGDKQTTFHVDNCQTVCYQPAFDIQPKLYSLNDYIALNERNIGRYHAMLALTDKISFIEDILTANILAFLKGIGYRAEEQISCALTSMHEPREQNYKHVGFACFNLQFVSNIELPDNIGLGKSSSIGFGNLKRLTLPRQFKDFKDRLPQ